MRIRHVTLNSRDIANQKHFFTRIMGMAIEAETDTAFTIRAGSSTLTFNQDSEYQAYHYAFDIPENQFNEARQWLGERVEVIADKEGTSEFPFPDWNAHAMYFRDGDGNIAEFIARHNLPTASTLPFSAKSIVRISEVGLVSPQVIQTVALLKRRAGLKAWRGVGSETFTAVGNEEGLLIVVREGRPWRPTQDVLSVPAPIELVLEGAASLAIPGLPYVIHAASPEPIQQVE